MSEEFWNPAQVSALRSDLGMTAQEFSKLVGVDVRSVTRWESTGPRPKGAPVGILAGLYFSLLGSNAKAVRVWLRLHVQLGGNMASLIVKMLGSIPEAPCKKKPPRKRKREILFIDMNAYEKSHFMREPRKKPNKKPDSHRGVPGMINRRAHARPVKLKRK